jgi:hypothetical protein
LTVELQEEALLNGALMLLTRAFNPVHMIAVTIR